MQQKLLGISQLFWFYPINWIVYTGNLRKRDRNGNRYFGSVTADILTADMHI